MGAHRLLQPIRSIPLLLAGLLLAAPASAAIYRWTDSSGVIHYSQTPPTSGKAHNLVELREAGAGVGTPSAAPDTSSKPAAKDAKRPDKAGKKPVKAKAKAPETPEQRAARCSKARKTLTLVQTHRRIRVHEANGSVENMSEAQRQKKIKSLKAEIAKSCS